MVTTPKPKPGPKSTIASITGEIEKLAQRETAMLQQIDFKQQQLLESRKVGDWPTAAALEQEIGYLKGPGLAEIISQQEQASRELQAAQLQAAQRVEAEAECRYWEAAESMQQLNQHSAEMAQQALDALTLWARANSETAKAGGRQVIPASVCGESRILHTAERVRDLLLTADAGEGLAKARQRLAELHSA